MRENLTQRLSRLRGGLPAEEPGARGIEHVARNPCPRLRSVVMAGVKPKTIVTDVLGETLHEGQSPFALAAGNSFEAYLFESGAARLLDLFRREGRLATAECKVVSVPEAAPAGGPRQIAHAMRLREALTLRLLRQKASGDPGAPNLIIKPRLRVNLVGDVSHFIEPDALVAGDGDLYYGPVEVKSYPDRGGKTDPADIRGACRQAAVGVIAIRQEMSRLGIAPASWGAPACDLVLRIPGSFGARLRSQAVAGEVDSLERMINAAPQNLDELEDLLANIGPGATLSDPAVIDAIPNNYVPSCREFCPMARHCKEQAIASGDPVLLGLRAREALAGAGSLGRAIELLNGSGRPARPGAEESIERELSEADEAFREALRYGT